MFDWTKNIERSRELVHALDQTSLERWLHIGVFTFQWWLLVGFLILPWVVWIKLKNRTRALELVLVGTLVALMTTLLDIAGYNLDFWEYPVQLFPVAVPGAIPFDLSMVPVPYMLIYQYCRSWKSYLLALLGMAVIYAFIGEPMCNLLLFVLYFKWRTYYSFVLYLVLGVAVRVLVGKLSRMYENSVRAAGPS